MREGETGGWQLGGELRRSDALWFVGGGGGPRGAGGAGFGLGFFFFFNRSLTTNQNNPRGEKPQLRRFIRFFSRGLSDRRLNLRSKHRVADDDRQKERQNILGLLAREPPLLMEWILKLV